MVAKPQGIKHIIALALALALTFVFTSVSLVHSAFAADGDMPTGNGSITVHKYENSPAATQAGDGTELNPGLSNTPLAGVEFTVAPVQGLNLNSNADWAKVEGLTYDGQTVKDAQGGTYQLGAGTAQTTDGEGVTVFAGLPVGVYLVTETNTGDNAITKKVAPFFVTIPFPNADGDWITDVHVYPKNDVNTPGTKEADDANLKKIGDEIPWTITTTATDAKPSQYGVVDQLQSYLTYVENSAAVKIGETALEAGDFQVEQGTKGTTNQVKYVKITLTDAGLAKVTAGATVTFTLKTTITALPEGGIVKNAAWPIDGEYDPFQGYDPDDPDPDDPPIVPTEDPKYGQYQFTKVDAQTPAKALSGAKFGIYADAQATQLLAEATSDDQGVVNFPGIYIGKGDKATQRTVYLKEIEAPAGFVLNDQIKAITIVPGTHELNPAENVVNTPQTGPNLPLTGAQGKVLLTIAGLAVLATAGGMAFVNMRRKNA
ncbi:MAG: SpaH/EbpB family LPXTG-anchored major pilin [Actinomycetaceae bacterium]|nr:SpaH/EbpB family LPXTG-anchored major pilin [Actinomycetaceae bacterium]MDY6143190.1 SpaH/EbpB family LPXTG-anchored major pilin [Arcanobacterium sp.]